MPQIVRIENREYSLGRGCLAESTVLFRVVGRSEIESNGGLHARLLSFRNSALLSALCVYMCMGFDETDT